MLPTSTFALVLFLNGVEDVIFQPPLPPLCLSLAVVPSCHERIASHCSYELKQTLSSMSFFLGEGFCYSNRKAKNPLSLSIIPRDLLSKELMGKTHRT